MPALDIEMVSRLGHDLHPLSNGLGGLAEGEVCPWTLFLTMALTLLKGVLPHVPRLLPMFVSDPELRERAAATFDSEDFKNNIESYFVENIKADIQSPLNKQILKSSETVMYAVELLNNLVTAFMGPEQQNDIDVDEGLGSGDKPRAFGNNLGQMFEFAKTIYGLMK
jgi:hypothetical protein